MDNGNLDKGLALLEPIKEKYGSKLSWGDLIVLAGTTGMEVAGHPSFGFCGGRIDDPDGSESLILGPSEAQEELTPCQSIGQQGHCQSPLGQSTIGLIYVNPEGPEGAKGNTTAAADDIRDVFARMGFDDRESVALIGGSSCKRFFSSFLLLLIFYSRNLQCIFCLFATLVYMLSIGGHAFGKCHGACMNPPCGAGELEGKGIYTYTSGLEGKWTTQPTKWTNEFFNNLFDFEYQLVSSPAGFVQYEPIGGPDNIMLTTDLALAVDPIYEVIAREFASNITALEEAYGAAWYRLKSADMGPANRCIGDDVRPPQPWQNTLPEGPKDLPDYVPIRAAIDELLEQDSSNIGKFATLAQNCARTFRETDYRGGCNGARIRFPPESEWDYNSRNDGSPSFYYSPFSSASTLELLEPIKVAHPDISYSDLIVLAGNAAVEAADGPALPFCGGRVDAEDGSGSEGLGPRLYATPYLTLSDYITVAGLTKEEGVALLATPRAGVDSNSDNNVLSNQYFVDLQEEYQMQMQQNQTQIQKQMMEENEMQMMQDGTGSYTAYELAALEEDLADIVARFVEDNDYFLEQYASGWTYMMTADRFVDSMTNACDGVAHPTLASDPETDGAVEAEEDNEEDVLEDEDEDTEEDDDVNDNVDDDGEYFLIASMTEGCIGRRRSSPGSGNGGNGALMLQECDERDTTVLWRVDEDGRFRSQSDDSECIQAGRGSEITSPDGVDGLESGVYLYSKECTPQKAPFEEFDESWVFGSMSGPLSLSARPDLCVSYSGVNPNVGVDYLRLLPCDDLSGSSRGEGWVAIKT